MVSVMLDFQLRMLLHEVIEQRGMMKSFAIGDCAGDPQQPLGRAAQSLTALHGYRGVDAAAGTMGEK